MARCARAVDLTKDVLRVLRIGATFLKPHLSYNSSQ
jgi:hypothetical protein